MNTIKKENIATVNSKEITLLKKQVERYYDKRYYLTRVKRKGKHIWGLKMFRRARQIEYFKRRRNWKLKNK